MPVASRTAPALIPPVVMVGALVGGFSATIAALLWAGAYCEPVPHDLDRLAWWIDATPPEIAVASVARPVGLMLAGWVLVPTLLYAGAIASRIPQAITMVEWATLPVARSSMQRLAAGSFVASSALAAIAPAHTFGMPPAPPIPIITLSTPTRVLKPVPTRAPTAGTPEAAATPGARSSYDTTGGRPTFVHVRTIDPEPPAATQPTTTTTPTTSTLPPPNRADAMPTTPSTTPREPHERAQESAPSYPGVLLGRCRHGRWCISDNTAVSEVQDRLVGLGYRIAIDGDFGAFTDGVVRSSQRRAGITVDGIVGPITWAALFPPASAEPDGGGS